MERPIPVTDKRFSKIASEVADQTPGVEMREESEQILMEESSDSEQQPVGNSTPDTSAPEPEISLDELKRMKADLDNDRKRMMRQHDQALGYATRDMTKRLIPIIDHLYLAVEHGEGGSGVELALKELLEVLRGEGFEEIEVSVGEPFDPEVHHALLSRPDPSVSSDVVSSVQRRGYRYKDQILRPVEVIVAQPEHEGGG